MVINKTFVRIPRRDSPHLTVQILGSFREVFGEREEGMEECLPDASLAECPNVLAVALESGDREGSRGENNAEMSAGSTGRENSATASIVIGPLQTKCAYILTVFLYP